MAYKFYNLLLARNISVEVHGDAWKDILGIETIEHECSSYATMKVYAEGTALVKKG